MLRLSEPSALPSMCAPHDTSNMLAFLDQHGGVDAEWYRKQYPELGTDIDPVAHYAIEGWREGRNPSPAFTTRWYLAQYPDIAAADINPLAALPPKRPCRRANPTPSLLDAWRVEDWWSSKISSMFAAIYATALLSGLSIISLWPVLALALVAIAPGAAYVSLINDWTDRAEDAAVGKRNALLGKPPQFVALLFTGCLVPGLLVAGGSNLVALPSSADGVRSDRADAFYIQMDFNRERWRESLRAVHATRTAVGGQWQVAEIPGIGNVAAASGIAATRDANGALHAIAQNRARTALVCATRGAGPRDEWQALPTPPALAGTPAGRSWWMRIYLTSMNDGLVLFGITSNGKFATSTFAGMHGRR